MESEVVLIWILLALAACLYFLPTCFAARRDHNNTTPIFLTNLFFGWTGIGWIVALIWAFSDNVKAKK